MACWRRSPGGWHDTGRCARHSGNLSGAFSSNSRAPLSDEPPRPDATHQPRPLCQPERRATRRIAPSRRSPGVPRDHHSVQSTVVPRRAQHRARRSRGGGRAAGSLSARVSRDRRVSRRGGYPDLADPDHGQRSARAVAAAPRHASASIRSRAAQRASAQVIPFPSAAGFGTTESAVESTHIRRLVEAAVDDLPDTFRTVFMLRDVDGCSIEETAATLGVRPETGQDAASPRAAHASRYARPAIEGDFRRCLLVPRPRLSDDHRSRVAPACRRRSLG